MLNLIQHGPVAEAVFSTRYTRAVGLRVSVFLHRGIAIDTGFARVADVLSAWVKTQRISGFVVTHWHEDHAGNLGWVVGRGIPVAVSADTLRRHRALTRVPLYRWSAWGHPDISRSDPEPADHPFQLIPTPGHSADHVAVYDQDARTIFLGDLFLGTKAATMLPDESPMEMVTSLKTVLALEPKVAFDSHRGLLRDPLAMLRAKADWLETTISGVRAAHQAGRPDQVIVKELLGGEERTALVSFGQLCKRNFVRAVLADGRSRAILSE